MRRRGAFPLVAAALMVALVWLSFGGDETAPPGSEPPVREPEARYYVTGVAAFTTTAKGQPSYRVRAERAAYFAEGERWELREPRWRGRDTGDRWDGRAKHGTITPTDNGGRQLLLSGAVHLHRSGPRPLTLRTDSLRLYPERDYAETSAPVHLHTRGSEMHARGAQAWLEPQRVELLADVRGTYAPQ